MGYNTDGTKSHLCCKCCCDCRRACLITNGIAIALTIFTMITMSITETGGTIDYLFFIVGIGSYVCGIYGALYFQSRGIMVAGGMYVFLIFFGGFHLFDIVTPVVAGSFLYPHVVMYKEIQDDIMTEHNYPNIAHCCGDRDM